jgi:signal transduction histidine kinase
MDEFLGIASHDLKTPLTSIKGNVQLIERRLQKSVAVDYSLPSEMAYLLTETQELLKRTDQQVTRMSYLVNTFLECARIRANTMDLLLEICELDTLIREVVQDRRTIPATRLLLLDLPEKTIFVMADANRVKQVVAHYLSNAHKYSELSRPIKIALCEEGQVVRVLVSDEGPGIPLKEQKRIWERFYRVPCIPVRNGTEVGLGLGLHVSKMVIEQLHGQVGVRSTPGGGSVFWFTLPLVREGQLSKGGL